MRAAVRSRIADVWHLVAIFYIVALWLVWAAELRNGYVRLMQFFIVTSAVLLGARMLAVVVLGGLERLRAAPAPDTRLPGLRACIGCPALPHRSVHDRTGEPCKS